jgi:lipopolysaccharide export LptBFGC system permease protein LptF
MNKTLFWYIFGNLFRVFLLTTAGLAGMMSFAVLLRPLTENGLEFNQVNRLLLYSLPAVSVYSLPVSALFATTMVYGRFSADNELTAMRASGISYFSPRKFSISLPALVLGLVVAFISLVMLCFIVPAYSMKMEEVVYSNIARVIANRIERTHSLEFQEADGHSYNIYADGARLVDDPKHPWLQSVELLGPAWMRYEKSPTDQDIAVPKEFWMAQKALVTIDRSTPAPMATVSLIGGIKFPRIFFGNVQVGVESSAFGPFEIPSLISENVKFMNITRLAQLAQDPGQSQDVQTILRQLRRLQQQQEFLAMISHQLSDRAADGTSSYAFPTDSPEQDAFEIGGENAIVQWRGGYLVVIAPGAATNRTVWLRQTHGSQLTLTAHAKEIDIRVQPNSDIHSAGALPADRFNVNVELFDLQMETPGEVSTARGSFSRSFSVPMPGTLQALGKKTLVEFLRDPLSPVGADPGSIYEWKVPEVVYRAMEHNQIRANNAARSELHGRASFALSCFSLVLVGCALGVMFRSGNFLNAFACSFVPALLCMTLIVGGQQNATHVPFVFDSTFKDPLPVSLVIIWIGNVLVLIAAIYLTVRLQRR